MCMRRNMADLKYSGPYRATKLWNEMVYTFRNGMPLKRHRRHIKVYEECFSGVEAVRWFHAALQRNPSIGPDISKEQVVQLLNKFLKAGIFETVSSSSSNEAHQFKENGDLYQFCRRPLSTCVLRAPLMSASSNIPRKDWFRDQRMADTKISWGKSFPTQYGPDIENSRAGRGLNSISAVHTRNNFSNYTTHSQRQCSLTINQAYNNDRENIPPRYTEAKVHPTKAAQGKPNSYGEQIPKRFGEIQRQHASAVNLAGDFSHNYILHRQNEDNLKHLHSVQHDKEGRGLSLQYEKQNGNVNRKHSVSARHEQLGSSQHGNVHNKFHNTNLKHMHHTKESPSTRDDKVPSLPSHLNRSSSGSPQNTDSLSAHNRLGIPHFSISPHDENSQLQKFHHVAYHSLPRKTTLHPDHCQFFQQSGHDNRQNFSHGISQNLNTIGGNSNYSDRVKEQPTSEGNICNNADWLESKQFAINDSTEELSSFPKYVEQIHFRGAMWQKFVLSRLEERLIGMDGLSSLLPSNLPDEWFIANVTLEELPRYKLPQQYLHIIKYLQYCHEAHTTEAANAVKDYFCRLSEPLTTFELYNILTQTFLFVEYVNNSHTSQEQRFENIPSQSVENLVLGMASPCQSKIGECGTDLQITDYGQLISGSKLHSTVLPPNSCFETAFTSDSPVTRIVPQRTIDSLHISRRTATVMRNSSVKLECSSSQESTQRNLSLHSSGPDPHSKAYAVPGLLGRNSSAPNLSEIHPENKPTSYRKVKASEKLGARMCRRRMSVKGEKSGWHGWKNSRESCNVNPPENQLQHCRNKSGGYVNPALSQSLDDGVDVDLPLHELDYVAALETLQKLMQYSRNTSGVSHNEKIIGDSGSECSGSESGSYYTAASSSRESSCRDSQVLSDSLESTISGNGSYYTAASSSRESSCRDSQVLSDSLESTISDADQWSQEGMSLGVTVLQLLLLLIPPSNRVQLCHLLHFLRQLSSSRSGPLHSAWDTMKVGACFATSILRSKTVVEYDAALACRIVNFLVTHEDAIMQVPSDLQTEVMHEIKERIRQQLPQPQVTYCEQVSSHQFEQQRLTESQLALSELLEQILADNKMGPKEKKKRIKMFKESYPDIYQRRFPPPKQDEKRRGFLHFPSLSRLKSLRV
ncbi:DEP domain-containing protein 1A [Anabrus simplex]|uniref:DEP domain-containing protein 1A n=1 Tax=Anabrus simplex TaxID=316456 RepID=UPI0035A3046A